MTWYRWLSFRSQKIRSCSYSIKKFSCCPPTHLYCSHLNPPKKNNLIFRNFHSLPLILNPLSDLTEKRLKKQTYTVTLTSIKKWLLSTILFKIKSRREARNGTYLVISGWAWTFRKTLVCSCEVWLREIVNPVFVKRPLHGELYRKYRKMPLFGTFLWF